jgi:hypothetical protein
MVMVDSTPRVAGQRKPINYNNILVGGMMNLFEVSSSTNPDHEH